MLTEVHAPGVAAELAEALEALLQHDPTAVWQFEQTFHFRSTVAGLIETHKGSHGIEGALAELFSNRFSVEPSPSGGNDKKPDEKFVIEFRRAIQMLSERHPLALLLLKRNQLREQCSLEEALQALFSEYSRRAKSYPY